MRAGGPRYAALALMLVCAVVSFGAVPEPEARRALAEQVRGAMAVARFEEAAALAEQYAERYPEDAETPAMLATVHLLRSGLGQDDLARAAIDRLDRLYRGKSPVRAGLLRARLELTHDFERERLLKIFLERHGDALAPDERLVLAAQLAQMQWRLACDQGYLLDLCLWSFRRFSRCADCGYERPRKWRLKTKPPPPRPPPPPRCVSRLRAVVRGLHVRDRPGSNAAQRRFAAVLAAADGVEVSEPDRRAALDEAVVMSTMYTIDAQFEALLATDRPPGLKFAFAKAPAGAPKRRWYFEQLRARARSVKMLRDYFERTDRAAGELERRYGEVVAGDRGARWTIAALARIAQVSDYRADMAYADDLPAGLTHPADVAAYCELARAYAEPLYERAIEAYARCFEVAAATGVLSEYARVCEEALTEMAPERFPARTELFGATPGGPASIGLQLDPGLDGE